MSVGDEWGSLDAWLSGEDVPAPTVDTGDAETPLALDGQDDANKALRRLYRLEAQAEDVEDVAKAEIERVKLWLEDRLAGIASRRQWVESGLESFMRQHHETTGTVTLDLPNGVLRLRPRQPKVDVVDPEQFPTALPALAGMRPDLVKIEHSPIKPAVKKAAQPGSVIEAPDVLGIEVPEGYNACFAHDNDTGQVLPGVYFLITDQRSFSLQTRRSSE